MHVHERGKPEVSLGYCSLGAVHIGFCDVVAILRQYLTLEPSVWASGPASPKDLPVSISIVQRLQHIPSYLSFCVGTRIVLLAR